MLWKFILGLLLAAGLLTAMVKIKTWKDGPAASASVSLLPSAFAAEVAPPENAPCPKCCVYESFVCTAPGCVAGKIVCPEPCLKPELGPWVHLKVEGHPDSDVWKVMPHPDGKGWNAKNQNHYGEIVAFEGGKWVGKGKCPTCLGTMRVGCPVCSVRPVCEVCFGKKVAEPAAYRAYLKEKVAAGFLKTFTTRDGRTVTGRVLMRANKKISLRLPSGESVMLKESDLADG